MVQGKEEIKMGYGSKNRGEQGQGTYTAYASNGFLLQDEFSRNTGYTCLSKITRACASVTNELQIFELQTYLTVWG